MKKDGIQTRNRKMSTKSKKKARGSAIMAMGDMLDPVGKSSFMHNLSHHGGPMGQMPTYMPNSMHAGSMGSMMSSSFMGAPSHQHHGAGGYGHAGGFGSGFSFPQQSSLPPTFPGIPSSGLNLTTNSSMVGAMA